MTTYKSEELDRQYYEDIAALRKRYKDLEASKWQTVLNIDILPSTSNLRQVSVCWKHHGVDDYLLTRYIQMSAAERVQPVIMPSSAAPSNKVQGLMAPRVSGYDRGFGGSSKLIRHGPQTIASHDLSTIQANGSRKTSGPSMHADSASVLPSIWPVDHPMAQMPPGQLTRNDHRILPGTPTTNGWLRYQNYASASPDRIPPLHPSYLKGDGAVNGSATECQVLPPILGPQSYHRCHVDETVRPVET